MTFSRTLHALFLLMVAGGSACSVALAQTPTSLSVSPGLIYLPPAITSCYTLAVGNGANMIADIKYRLNGGAEQTIESWPDLNSDGQRYVCTDSATPLGTYTFTAVRRHGTATWVTVNATITIASPPPQPTSLTFNGATSSAGYAGNDSYVLHAGNAAGMTIDLEYTVNGTARPPATLTVNASGDWNYTLLHFDEQGPWHFTRMKNHLRSDWVDIAATYTILPPKPTSASISPSTVVAGQGAYVWTVGNGANEGMAVRYTLTSSGVEGPEIPINGWPFLSTASGTNGQESISVGACTAVGTYRFKWIKNHANPDSTAIAISVPVTVTPPPAPAVTSIIPVATRPGASEAIAIFGANLCGVTLSTTYPGLSFASIPDDPTSPGTGVQTVVTVAPNAQPGVATILVTARGGSTSFPFNVSSASPPTITSVSPSSAGPGSTQVTLTGTNLIGGMLSTAWPGVSFDNYSYGSQGTTLGVRITLTSAPAGTAAFAVTTPGGSASTPFTVTATGSPTISSLKEYIYVGDRLLAVDSMSTQASPPSPPVQLTGQALNPYTVQLQWQPATASPGMAISAYQIKRGSTVIASVGGSQLSYVDASASQNTSYSYRALAKDNWNPTPQVSADSNNAPVTTPRETVPPTVPSSLYVPNSGADWIVLAWNPSTDSGGSGLAGYYVYFTGSPDPISTLITQPSFVIDFNWWPGLDWSYFTGFDVRAVDNAGNFSQPGHWE